MTKLNGFESHAIITGLEMYKNTLKQERNPIDTERMLSCQFSQCSQLRIDGRLLSCPLVKTGF